MSTLKVFRYTIDSGINFLKIATDILKKWTGHHNTHVDSLDKSTQCQDIMIDSIYVIDLIVTRLLIGVKRGEFSVQDTLTLADKTSTLQTLIEKN